MDTWRTGTQGLLGLLAGLAAFVGGSLNLLYLLAGSAGINPIMLILSLFLLMAWKVAGYYGLDRFVLPAITVRFQHRAANIGVGITTKSIESVPNIAMKASATALSLDDLHGFE